LTRIYMKKSCPHGLLFKAQENSVCALNNVTVMQVASTPWPKYSETYSEVAAEAMEDASSSKGTWQPREYRGRTSGRRERDEREYRKSYDRTTGGNTYFDLHMTDKPTVMKGRQLNNDLTRFNNDLGKTLQRIEDGEDVELHPTQDGQNKEYQKQVSKKLSATLRHSLGLTVYKDGSLELSPLLNILPKWQRNFLMDDDNLLYLVQSSDKQRFQLTYAPYENEANTTARAVQFVVHIRAVQGHSGEVGRMIDSCKAMEKITEEDCPAYCVHATMHASIRKSGMMPGGPRSGTDNRTHVHFATQFIPGKGATLPGVRINCNDWYFLRLKDYVQEGHEAFLAANDVVCIPNTIPFRYFTCVVDVWRMKDRITSARPDDFTERLLQFRKEEQAVRSASFFVIWKQNLGAKASTNS
jgi:RNA:NAD 2'-phosphotransferase (TPT1/KptA family)